MTQTSSHGTKPGSLPKGYNQAEGIDYDENFASVARLEAIRLLLAFACMSGFKLF